jgi:hypothetical protein
MNQCAVHVSTRTVPFTEASRETLSWLFQGKLHLFVIIYSVQYSKVEAKAPIPMAFEGTPNRREYTIENFFFRKLTLSLKCLTRYIAAIFFGNYPSSLLYRRL